jgi:hypothetical protein
MALRAQLATIRRILASLFAPPGAGTLALSSEARVQSIRPASWSRCKSVRCKRLQTPARCQSRKRRQHVMPLPQPSSWGSISQGMPLFKTNTMPDRAARSVMLRGRPPLGFGGSGGNSGAMISHNASLTNGVLMPLIYHTAWVLLGALRTASGDRQVFCSGLPSVARIPAACAKTSGRKASGSVGATPGISGGGGSGSGVCGNSSGWR